MKSTIIALFLGSISASSLRQISTGYTLPEANICTNANKATTEDEACSTAGNSAWNTITSARTGKPADAQAAPYPGHAEHLQLSAAPEANTCTNANKATTTDEPCSTPGNSAWNTKTTSRTGNPADAQAAPYPGHTLHLQMLNEGYTLPEANICTNANKATTEDEACSTAGNSAWNTITSARTGKPADAQAAPYPGHAEHLQLGLNGYTLPEANICTNANKATTEDEACSTAGNSAWNTITSARTGKPADAQADPYPGHTLH